MIANITAKTGTFRTLAIVIVSVLLLFSLNIVSAQSVGEPPSGSPPDGAPPSGQSESSTTNPVLVADCGVLTLEGDAGDTTDGQTYDSSFDDVSAICLIDGSSLTLENPTITKTGETSSADESSFYGLNAAVLVGSGSTMTMVGGTVVTDGAGTNGVFATGEDASVTLSDVVIDANGDGAHAVMATLGGALTLTNVDMNTTGPHSGAIATDRGSGTIAVIGGTVTTSGQDSPGIYSTGDITGTDVTVVATNAESVVIEGANSVTLTDSDLTSSVADKWGVMIYQSFSGDAEGTHGIFTMIGGSLAHTAASGPLFFITNSTATITLTDVHVVVESGVLVQAGATDRWGTSGSNGGSVILTTDGQSLTGDMVADSISSLTITLENESALTGTINADDTAAEANLTLDETSTWNVTADSYLTCLADADAIVDGTVTNIVGNGHTVYYDASVCTALGGETYALSGGGSLQPAS